MSVESQNTPDEKNPAKENTPPGVEIIIEPRKRDLGGFSVGRVLPYARRRMVGPFIFFDEMGPAEFPAGKGIDVRPHPHIGLATVTYLFEGEIRHRDDLGSDQIIRPGDVNWMTAGRGIVHSERTDAKMRGQGHALHGIQSWIALPEAAEKTDPSFHHHPRETLPLINRSGERTRLIAGRAFGETSPVKTYSDMFYLGVEAEDGAAISIPDDHEERALYLVKGALSVNGREIAPGRMLVFEAGATPEIKARAASQLMLLGGANIGPRIIWWNLVATSQELIEGAKRDWVKAAERGFDGGRFSMPPGESDFIPLPEA